MPSPGPLDVFALPEGMEHVRIDSGYRQGDVVTPHYDPMVAKLTAWGADSDTARGRAATALRALRVEGIRPIREFLIACVADETFAARDVHTGFIDACSEVRRVATACVRNARYRWPPYTIKNNQPTFPTL